LEVSVAVTGKHGHAKTHFTCLVSRNRTRVGRNATDKQTEGAALSFEATPDLRCAALWCGGLVVGCAVCVSQ
jgi:hypothetical protein